MTFLVAAGVSKRWGSTIGLAAVDVAVAPGELVVVRGRSGSGKSTLLAMFAGWVLPDTGTVLVGGRPPSADDPWPTLAIVPQVLALAAELSVGENVADGLDATAVTRVGPVLQRMGLDTMVDRTIREISMGQQQRVAVGRALAAAPRAILADEPTSFQDAGHAGTVVEALRDAAHAGTAVLVATHDPTVIAAADRVLDLGAT